MTTHFHAIGFPVEDEHSFLALAQRVAEEGDELRVPGGSYRRWAPGAGAEVWAQSTEAGSIDGLDPDFAGDARLDVRLDAHIAGDAGGGPLSATVEACVNPNPAEPEDMGDYPLLVDAPGLRRHGELLLPSLATAQIAAFAESLEVFADEAAFAAAQEEGPMFAPESFVPTGMFGKRPSAHALLHGTVLASESRINPATGAAFTVISVRTLGGAYDVVADPTLGAPPPAGAIVRVEAWLSGRFDDVRPQPGAKPPAPPRREGRLGRLLRRR